uniref:Uncharacterized protein n=1 Tax=Anopheles farauti TaxID=69004 RepID=A0A182QA47_9DIPT
MSSPPPPSPRALPNKRAAVHFSSHEIILHPAQTSCTMLTTDDGVESVVLIGSVVDDAAVTIGIDQSVLSDHVISVAILLLALDVAGVVIVHGVLELVLGRSIRVFNVLHGNRKNSSAGNGHHGEQNADL